MYSSSHSSSSVHDVAAQIMQKRQQAALNALNVMVPESTLVALTIRWVGSSSFVPSRFASTSLAFIYIGMSTPDVRPMMKFYDDDDR